MDTHDMDDFKVEVLPNDFNTYDLSFKIIIIGDSGVGKSCLTLKATKDYFEEYYSATVGFEFFTFNVKIDGKYVKLQIWDTCGQEIYRSLISSFYRNSSLAMMVYAIDNMDSFDHIGSWLNEVKTQSSPDVKIFLIGNKTDLENKRKVRKDVADKFALENKLDLCMETSAKSGFNAKNIFIEAAKMLYAEHLRFKDRASKGSLGGNDVKLPQPQKLTAKRIDGEEEKKKKGCC